MVARCASSISIATQFLVKKQRSAKVDLGARHAWRDSERRSAGLLENVAQQLVDVIRDRSIGLYNKGTNENTGYYDNIWNNNLRSESACK
jgi:hypothetical protein